jgi:hypothetical protein
LRLAHRSVSETLSVPLELNLQVALRMAQMAGRLAKASLRPNQLLTGTERAPVVVVYVTARRTALAPPGLLTAPARGLRIIPQLVRKPS